MDVHGQPSQQWDEAMESTTVKWQPVMLIAPTRIECPCGNLAIFLCLAVDDEGAICDGHAYCQTCYAAERGE